MRVQGRSNVWGVDHVTTMPKVGLDDEHRVGRSPKVKCKRAGVGLRVLDHQMRKSGTTREQILIRDVAK